MAEDIGTRAASFAARCVTRTGNGLYLEVKAPNGKHWFMSRGEESGPDACNCISEIITAFLKENPDARQTTR